MFVNPVDETGEFVASVTGRLSDTTLSVHYQITPATDIETSLAAFEQGDFEHFTPEPPRPGENPLQTVFDCIKDAHEESNEPTADRAIFDGSYQCRECGTVQSIGMFAGAAKPPGQIGTDCEQCGGERQCYAIAPDADAVLHRWECRFEDVTRDPYRVELTAASRTDAQTQTLNEHPDRTVEVVVLLEERAGGARESSGEAK